MVARKKPGQDYNGYKNEGTFFDITPIEPQEARDAMLALIGAKLNSEDPPCGLEDVMGALAIRETIFPPEPTEEELEKPVAKPEKIVRPTRGGKYEWCGFCGKRTVHELTMRCIICNRSFNPRTY